MLIHSSMNGALLEEFQIISCQTTTIGTVSTAVMCGEMFGSGWCLGGDREPGRIPPALCNTSSILR